MIIMGGDVRPNMKLEMDGDVWNVVSSEHYKREQRRAIVRTRLKSISTGRVIERNFNVSDSLEQAELDLRDMSFLYREGDDIVFMDEQSYEQMHLTGSLLGDAVGYLKENSTVTVSLHKGKAIGVELPPKVNLKVTETTPAVRGNTVQAATKAATVETGLVVQVPMFVNAGDVIRVSTRDGSYVERV
jgi:elongation factor P